MRGQALYQMTGVSQPMRSVVVAVLLSGWLVGNGRAALVGFDVPASDYPRIFQVNTLRDALAVLRGDLPPTDALSTAAPASASGNALTLLAMVVLVLLAWRRRWALYPKSASRASQALSRCQRRRSGQ
jgi:hypothetical protein